MDLSVVIVNWNVRDLLQGCLQSVLDGTGHLRNGFEIVVVDNASADASVEMLRERYPGVRVVVNPENVGFAAANNQALPLCRGRYVVLLNPDTLVPRGGLERLVEHMDARGSVGAMGCRLLNEDGSLQRWTAGAFPSLMNIAAHYLFLTRVLPGRLRPRPLYLDRDVQEDLEVDWVSGACLILRRAAVGERIFDEGYFMYGEDMDLCFKLKREGWKIMYSPAASVIHFQGQSMKQQSGEVMLSSLKSMRLFFRKTHGPVQLFVLDLLTAVGFTARWALYGLAYGLSARGRFLEKARSSRLYLGIAVRLMCRGGAGG